MMSSAFGAVLKDPAIRLIESYGGGSSPPIGRVRAKGLPSKRARSDEEESSDLHGDGADEPENGPPGAAENEELPAALHLSQPISTGAPDTGGDCHQIAEFASQNSSLVTFNLVLVCSLVCVVGGVDTR